MQQLPKTLHHQHFSSLCIVIRGATSITASSTYEPILLKSYQVNYLQVCLNHTLPMHDNGK